MRLWVSGLSLAALLTASPSMRARPAVELARLQGHWEGEGAGGRCSITIMGNSLHYRAGTSWYKTTFTLPAGTDPQQLHATIKESSAPSKDGVDTVVFAIIALEDETLTLVAYDVSDEPPKDFATATTRYVVRKVRPQKDAVSPQTR